MSVVEGAWAGWFVRRCAEAGSQSLASVGPAYGYIAYVVLVVRLRSEPGRHDHAVGVACLG
ncbi:hypothetical protein JGX56_004650 [Salmonella enterica]|nr:hypothetical protein [Salmonella enterica]